jgi:hypothetical protein
MSEVVRLLLLLALAGVVLTLLGGGMLWFMDESRRIRRGLKHVLGTDPHALLVAQGRRRGVGFDFTTCRMAVAWDSGAWCLVYRLDELVGAELILDGQVVARVHRGEARRPLDLITGADSEVRLRLVFDDPRHPDFDLQLWLPGDEGRKGALSASDAVQEANRWLGRVEAMLRRPLPRREAGPAAAAPPCAPIHDGGPDDPRETPSAA